MPHVISRSFNSRFVLILSAVALEIKYLAERDSLFIYHVAIILEKYSFAI